MDVVIRLFPVTSTSLSVVFGVCSGFRDGVLGSVCALSSSLFTCGFVNGGVASGFLFRIGSLRRVFVTTTSVLSKAGAVCYCKEGEPLTAFLVAGVRDGGLWTR